MFLLPTFGQNFKSSNLDQLNIKGNAKVYVATKDNTVERLLDSTQFKEDSILLFVKTGTVTKNISRLSNAVIVYSKPKEIKESVPVLAKNKVVIKPQKTQKKKTSKSIVPVFTKKDGKQHFSVFNQYKWVCVISQDNQKKDVFLISEHYSLFSMAYMEQSICFRYKSKKQINGCITSFVARPPPFFPLNLQNQFLT